MHRLQVRGAVVEQLHKRGTLPGYIDRELIATPHARHGTAPQLNMRHREGTFGGMQGGGGFPRIGRPGVSDAIDKLDGA